MLDIDELVKALALSNRDVRALRWLGEL